MAKILVIDTEECVRYLLDSLLSRKGYTVTLAANSREGLELFRREPPDAIVLDLKTPMMDEFATLQQIRLVNQKVPVIVLTTIKILEMAQQVHASGVTEFIDKEFSLSRIVDSLKRHLDTVGTAM
jgi:two-component system response regulator (stage 0 sporulation protein F)